MFYVTSKSAFNVIKINVTELFQDADSLTDYISSHIQFYKDKGLVGKPFVVVQGSLDKLQSYVIVQDTTYRVSSPIRAADVCYKITKALGCGFSSDSKNSWLYLGKYLYGIEGDTVPSAVRELKSSVAQWEQRNQTVMRVPSRLSDAIGVFQRDATPQTTTSETIVSAQRHVVTPQTPSRAFSLITLQRPATAWVSNSANIPSPLPVGITPV